MPVPMASAPASHMAALLDPAICVVHRGKYSGKVFIFGSDLPKHPGGSWYVIRVCIGAKSFGPVPQLPRLMHFVGHLASDLPRRQTAPVSKTFRAGMPDDPFWRLRQQGHLHRASRTRACSGTPRGGVAWRQPPCRQWRSGAPRCRAGAEPQIVSRFQWLLAAGMRMGRSIAIGPNASAVIACCLKNHVFAKEHFHSREIAMAQDIARDLASGIIR